MTLQGTLTDLNNALTHLGYKGTLNYNGADTLTVTVDDSGTFGTGGAKTATNTVGITVTPVDDAPSITAPAAQSIPTAADTTITSVSFADVDVNETVNGQLTATFTVSHGVVTLAARPASP